MVYHRKKLTKYNPYNSNEKGNIHFCIMKSKLKNAGMGCFARKDFVEGELCDEYKGKLIAAVIDPKYVWTLANRYHIDAKSIQFSNPMRYVNGGRTKSQRDAINVVMKEENNRVFYYAKKNIKKGDELIVDYGTRYWTKKEHWKN